MEQSEKIYRATAKTNRKYLKRLSDYIDALVKLGRFLEARHFFLELCKLGPNHLRTIRLGYTIAIATFDKGWVNRYDKLLFESTKDGKEVNWYRLQYYQSQNNVAACEATSCELLKNILNAEQLSAVIKVCIAQNSYVIAESLAMHLLNHRITLISQYNDLLKQIVIARLVCSLQRCK